MTAKLIINKGTRNHTMMLGTEAVPFREQNKMHRTAQALARNKVVTKVTVIVNA